MKVPTLKLTISNESNCSNNVKIRKSFVAHEAHSFIDQIKVIRGRFG